eukprot:TCONS_00035529-protein
MADPSKDAVELVLMSQAVTDITNETPIQTMEPDQVTAIFDKVEKIRFDMNRLQLTIKLRKEVLPDEFDEIVTTAVQSIKDFHTKVYEVQTQHHKSINQTQQASAATVKEET